MSDYADVYRSAAGVGLVPGTLNVELDRPWRMPASARRFSAGLALSLIPCQIEGIEAWVLRTDKNESGTGDHPRTLVEIVSDKRLREVAGLADGDEVTVVLP